MAKAKLLYDYTEAKKELERIDALDYSGFELVYKVWKTETNPTEDDTIEFSTKFVEGFKNRPSVRISGETKTKADRVIDQVIRGRIKNITDKRLDDIRFAHKISMGAENIIGAILEEYIHWALWKYGWSICWGNCFKAVDLCSREGKLIQIKNKSNTENSSSNKIRVGTEIQKWYRMNANTGVFCWDKLMQMTKCPNGTLSEEQFEGFARLLINKNQKALYVDENELQAFLS